MLFARAMSNGARWYCPGIFGGSPVYTADEMGVDFDEEGYIDAETVTVTEPVTTEPKPDTGTNTSDTGPRPHWNEQRETVFFPGEAVLVAGKNDERLGTVIEMNGGGLVKVEVDGNQLHVKPDRLTLFPDVEEEE